jgi:hypothetical protein
MHNQLPSQRLLVPVDALVGLEDFVTNCTGIPARENNGDRRIEGVTAVGEHFPKSAQHVMAIIGVA